jgi:hypothetical protein
MPILNGHVLGRGMMEGAERALQAAARRYGQAFWNAYSRAMSLDMTDPVNRKIISDMMRSDDAGKFLMEVFADEVPGDMPHDAELAAALRKGTA